MVQYNLSVQVVAEQLNDAGVYIHVDSEYFSESEKMKDWISGAVEWADRFKIFKVGTCEHFFQGIVVKNAVPKWEKLRIDDHRVVDLYT